MNNIPKIYINKNNKLIKKNKNNNNIKLEEENKITDIKRDIGILKNIFADKITGIDSDNVLIPNILVNCIDSSSNITIKKPLCGNIHNFHNKITYEPIDVEYGINIKNNIIKDNNSVLTKKEISDLIDYKLQSIFNNLDKRIKKLEK